METTKEDGDTMHSSKFKDIHILNIIKDLQTKYSSAKNANDQSMAEISRLELENIEFRKELRLCKEYVREVDKIREHEGNSTVLLTEQECHDFTQYKEQYNYRINQTMIMHNMWPTEPIDETSQEQNADNDQDFMSILNENDALKREIYQIESENGELLKKSNSNQDKIIQLLKTFEELQKDKQVYYQNLKFENNMKSSQEGRMKIDLANNTIPNFAPEDGLITKRSSAATDRVIFQQEPLANANNSLCSFNQHENSTVKDFSIERWAKEYNIYDASVLSIKTDRIFKNCSTGCHNSVERLINELKDEYKLNDSDVTQLKFDIDSTPEPNKSFANSICKHSNNKELIKNNLFLGLINKKLNNIVDESSSKINGSFICPQKQANNFGRSKNLKKQRRDFGLMSNLFGELIV